MIIWRGMSRPLWRRHLVIADVLDSPCSNMSPAVREQISFGPISWLMVGEVFPLAVRGQASALATMTNFASNFAVRWHAQAVSAATACQRACILASFSWFVAPVQAGHPGARLGLRIPPMFLTATRLHTCAGEPGAAQPAGQPGPRRHLSTLRWRWPGGCGDHLHNRAGVPIKM